MSLLERARAFAAIAPHLTAEKRAEVAAAFADEVAPRNRAPRAPRGHTAAIVELDEYRDRGLDDAHPVIAFLIEQGTEGPDLARLTGRMAAQLKGPWLGMRDNPPSGEQLQAAYEVATGA